MWKIMLLRTNERAVCNLFVGGRGFEKVEGFSYLGSGISKDGGVDTDKRARYNKSLQAFGILSNIWWATQISPNLNIFIFKSNVLSLLVYVWLRNLES